MSQILMNMNKNDNNCNVGTINIHVKNIQRWMAVEHVI